MIRSYNDHAANERTLLAWLRTGLSAVTLGIVFKKGSLVAAIAGVSSPEPSGPLHDYIGNFGGAVFIGLGIAAMAVATIRFVRTARRIDDQSVHCVGIVRLASALPQRRRRL
jgi:putative membrane protein